MRKFGSTRPARRRPRHISAFSILANVVLQCSPDLSKRNVQKSSMPWHDISYRGSNKRCPFGSNICNGSVLFRVTIDGGLLMDRYASNRRVLLLLLPKKLEQILRDGSRSESGLAAAMEGSLRLTMVCSLYSCLMKEINVSTRRSTADMSNSTKLPRGFSDGFWGALNSDKRLALGGKYCGRSRSP
ncbi:hypothetical protein ARMGADRAFT_758167 [Armillaria gallica]|uniref:Uncharacterized protein n=1 Tax=Armillaria gallica TaxID=47427 RepID=A0A2H3DQF0_ARMGA|nr:hypothetical protein ARMGADRAFT_758167 [Armillaria gallica]